MGFGSLLGFNSRSNSLVEAKARLAEGAILLDVRTADEYASHHIKGAKNIPVQSLPTRMNELPTKSKSIVVYCQSGMRSARAASLLSNAGYQVTDLGGIGNWQD
jgi:rhodanese-related sulfurtransferase